MFIFLTVVTNGLVKYVNTFSDCNNFKMKKRKNCWRIQLGSFTALSVGLDQMILRGSKQPKLIYKKTKESKKLKNKCSCLCITQFVFSCKSIYFSLENCRIAYIDLRGKSFLPCNCEEKIELCSYEHEKKKDLNCRLIVFCGCCLYICFMQVYFRAVCSVASHGSTSGELCVIQLTCWRTVNLKASFAASDASCFGGKG